VFCARGEELMAPRRRNARRSAPGLMERVRALGPAMLRWTHRGVVLAALALLVAGAHLAVEALRRLPVERIVVAGKLEHLQEEALRAALAPQLGDGLIFLDLEKLQAHLKDLPWVYRAQLRRKFPDTLEVRVVEQVPIARWGDEAFLNHEARIIQVTDAGRWADLPVLRGPTDSEARLMSHYRRLRQTLAPLGLAPVSLVEDEFGQLRAVMDTGLALQFGDHAFSDRLQRFERLWHAELAQAPLPARSVDLRYAEGAAVAFIEIEPEQFAGLHVSDEDG
jgi:cell division protein FtsQ